MIAWEKTLHWKEEKNKTPRMNRRYCREEKFNEIAFKEKTESVEQKKVWTLISKKRKLQAGMSYTIIRI